MAILPDYNADYRVTTGGQLCVFIVVTLFMLTASLLNGVGADYGSHPAHCSQAVVTLKPAENRGFYPLGLLTTSLSHKKEDSKKYRDRGYTRAHARRSQGGLNHG